MPSAPPPQPAQQTRLYTALRYHPHRSFTKLGLVSQHLAITGKEDLPTCAKYSKNIQPGTKLTRSIETLFERDQHHLRFES